MPNPTRRGVLASLTAAAAVAGCGVPPIIPALPRRAQPDAPWPGVGAANDSVLHAAIGDPTPSALGVVGRVVDPTAEVQAATWIDGAWFPLPPVPVTPDADGFFYVALDGLPADTPVAWQIITPTGASAIGHTRTTPDPNAKVAVVLAVSNCSNQSHGDFPALTATLSRGPVDAYLGLGDQVYLDRFHTLEAFRGQYALNLAQPGYQAVLTQTAICCTWDDHEVANNYAGASVDPERAAMGRRAMDDFLPTPRGGTIWRKLSFGATADVFLLDVRSERDPDAGLYVSPEQLQWVIDGVQGSTATWKLVCSPVPVAHMGGALDVPLVQNDTWNGAAYAAQRAALLEGLSGVPGVLIVSGDHHFPAVVKADANGPGADLWEIVTGPLGSRRQPAFVYLPDSPQLPWIGYAWCATLFALSPSGFARITFVGEDDETLFEGTFDDAGRLLSWEALPVSADDDPPA